MFGKTRWRLLKAVLVIMMISEMFKVYYSLKEKRSTSRLILCSIISFLACKRSPEVLMAAC